MDFHRQPTGWIEVICGCMFSGKTEELLRRVRRAVIGKQEVLLFKPKMDVRYHQSKILSHLKNGLEAVPIESSKQVLNFYQKVQNKNAPNSWQNQLVIAFDEAQFFDHDLPMVVGELANLGNRIIIAGLDKDFLGRPFGIMPELMAMAEYVSKIHAICVSCGNPANFSGRRSNEQSTIALGAEESYQPYCRQCYADFMHSQEKPNNPQSFLN